jgi:uncharacterized tellurite resistance protein B-like protein
MDTITFDQLLLKTAFCCMASDGHIDQREVELIKSLCEDSTMFESFDFQERINLFITRINSDSKGFIKNYFELLEKGGLTEEEELILIDFAVKTINADEQVEYSEIKFFKNIRHRLKIKDEDILKSFPDIEMYLEDDIVTESYIDTITSQYLDLVEFPVFPEVKLNIDLSED